MTPGLHLKTIASESGIIAPIYFYQSIIRFVGDMDSDGDGPTGNPFNDPTWQEETTLKLDGKSINPLKVPGVVVPLDLPKLVAPIVLGSLCWVTDLSNGVKLPTVVHDLGPTKKIGEGTPFLLEQFGYNGNPVNGGIDDPRFLYEIYCGTPALVNGVQYKLQKAP